MPKLAGIFIAILVMGCNPEIRVEATDNKIDSLPVPSDSSVAYFPFLAPLDSGKTVQNLPDAFLGSWYSGMLYSLREPVLYNYKGKNDIYRFTWLRTFDHPVVVRIQKASGVAILTLKMSDGAGGYEPGGVFRDSTFSFGGAQVDTLNALIDRADFRNMPIDTGARGKDGSEWVLEIVRDGSYHWAARWSPEKDTPFRAICEFMLKHSFASFAEDRVY